MVARPDSLELNFESVLPIHFKKLALAVSGGSDSMALLKLAHNLGLSSNTPPEFTILTVDHKLRAGSGREAEFVLRACQSLGLKGHILSWEGDKPSTGLQDAAREARYTLMIEKCRELKLDALVTAHTMDDQAETFLMRLKRGSGLDGLSAMSLVSEFDGFPVLRPLLGERRASLRSFLKDQGQDWIEDPSNEDKSFERVRIRSHMDDLEEMGFAPEHLAQSAARLMRAREAIEISAQEAISRIVSWYDAGYCQIANEGFSQLGEEIALRVLSHSLLAVGGARRPPRLKKLEQALKTWRGLSPGEGFTLAGCRLVMRKQHSMIVREVARKAQDPALHLLPVSPGETGLFDRRFWCEVSSIGAHKAKAPQFCIKALGKEGWHLAKEQTNSCDDMPSYVGRSLVSLWHGDQLLSVPHIGLMDEKISFHARFMPRGVARLPQMRTYSG